MLPFVISMAALEVIMTQAEFTSQSRSEFKCEFRSEFESLPTPAEMSLWDSRATALGLPEFLLMENASREAFHVLRECYAADGNGCYRGKGSRGNGSLEGCRVLLFMGKGNNGGDAAALARHMLDAGAVPLVVHTAPLETYAPTPAEHARVAAACGVPFMHVDQWIERQMESIQSPTGALIADIIIDGLLGTGFRGQLRALELRLVEYINASAPHAFVLSLDIPSGLNGLTGLPCPEAVRSHATVTFEAAKPGLILHRAKPFTGALHVRPIGIPACIKQDHPASFRKLGTNWTAALPSVQTMAHKGLAGHVLVAGGSVAYPGAAHLAALGAARTGAGLVSVAAPGELAEKIRAHDACLMPLALPSASSNTEAWTPKAANALAPLLAQLACAHGALVLGPGLGRNPDTTAFVACALALPRPHTVVDADALHHVVPALLRHTDILTPHPGEAAHLLRLSTTDVQADRFATLEKLKDIAPCVWVLKGEGTLIGQRGEATVISPYSVPTLAVGGSGDVLAGCCAALLAQGLSPLMAACVGVRLHAEAGLLLVAEFSGRGNSALHIAEALPRALHTACQRRQNRA